ncbi:cytochrome c3 family protein [Chitinophaga sp. 30R24]|uniref:cytochrome c3 family protein n=1 Tax=Chitinophaga sp. 30R24 TaxID=3248838 RepID=UPI003B920FBE
MNKRQLYVSTALLCCILILSQCIHKAPEKTDIRGEQFAGAETCINCHKNVYDTFHTSAHYNTSRPANKATVLGSFLPPNNLFSFTNGMFVKMEANDSGLFQTAYIQDSLAIRHRFDIVIGSGRKAQTSLYWLNDKYYQLPMSYFVPEHSWANSPGFPADYPRFDRVIPSTCFGCHSSGVAFKDVKLQGLHVEETFKKNEIIYGIDCERCHGPAAAHAAFHTTHPEEKQARYITRISSLNNQQKMDMCGVCHSGLQTPQRPAFAYKPGDPLSAFYFPDYGKPVKPAEMDVHGTQYQLFNASKCAMMSRDMNCLSCHHPHASESGNTEMFSQRCMNCHNTSHNWCKQQGLADSALKTNCIDCHMPALPSASITLLTNGQTRPTPDFIRTHRISIYPAETQKVIAKIRSLRMHPQSVQ